MPTVTVVWSPRGRASVQTVLNSRLGEKVDRANALVQFQQSKYLLVPWNRVNKYGTFHPSLFPGMEQEKSWHKPESSGAGATAG